MKRFAFLLISFVFVGTLFAQAVDVNSLPEELRQQVLEVQRVNKLEANMQRYGKWVGMGEELGNAVDGALSALSKHANEFANTKVGMFTMAIIAFKVVGYPVIQILAGSVLFIIGTIFFVIFFKNQCLSRRNLVKTSFDDKGKRIKEYETVEPGQYTAISTLGIYIVYILILCGIVFVH